MKTTLTLLVGIYLLINISPSKSDSGTDCQNDPSHFMAQNVIMQVALQQEVAPVLDILV
ncbi:MAG: hypothetical protein V4590_04655 [Bacteroidota bacterium]